MALIIAFRVVNRAGGAVGLPGNATAIPAGTGNAALAALAVRPWRSHHLSIRQRAE
jgi:hypothetical protein